ncbi:hypothetical protein [Ruminobacter sp. RM87]|uniref:hypothetical protein n=1 Tax=Ruminobacter sp. RM87 TaxID=1200567 RepID=UPI0004E1514D|nr:hypothetical protein [Ruminobacter sp. RM87]
MIKGQDVGIKIKEGKPLGFPSADELIEYSESGEDKKNALEYEKAYIALIEQVKDKSHEEQVKFLVSHMNELRGMLDLFSFCRDEELFPKSSLVTEPTVNDEVLANVMIYRYENKISILDDEYCEKTEDYARKIRSELLSELGRQQALAENKMAEENPEEFKALWEKRHRFFRKLAEELAEDRPYTQEEAMKLLMSDDE